MIKNFKEFQVVSKDSKPSFSQSFKKVIDSSFDGLAWLDESARGSFR